MPKSSRCIVTLVAAFAVLGLALVGTASAQRGKKAKPACNITAFPFIEGMQWVYQATAPPNPPKGPTTKPRQPATVTIKVLSITPNEAVRGESIIELEEKSQDRVYTSTLTCAKDAINVPPQSFYFSGEPGGGRLITLGEITRDEGAAPSYMFMRGKMVVPTWTADIDATFTRDAAEGSGAEMPNGSVDLQRNIMIGMPEDVTTQLGTFSATPLQVDLAGSVTLDFPNDPQKFPVPANTLSKLWFAENVGVVQVFNTNGHLYQLVEFTDPNAPPPAAAPATQAGAGAAKPGAAKQPAAKQPAPAAKPAQ